MKHYEVLREESAKRREIILDKMRLEKRLFNVSELHRLLGHEGNIHYDLGSLEKEGLIIRYKKNSNHVSYYCSEFNIAEIELNPVTTVFNQHCKLNNVEAFANDVREVLKEPLTMLAIQKTESVPLTAIAASR